MRREDLKQSLNFKVDDDGDDDGDDDVDRDDDDNRLIMFPRG